jgi:hypothetical protein
MAKIIQSNDQFIEELKLVQTVVTRMAQNSFFIKGWSIALIGFMLALNKEALIGDAQNWFLCLLIAVVTYCFWHLDAYFIRLERIFRKHYDWLLENAEDPKRQEFELTIMKYYTPEQDEKKSIEKRHKGKPVDSVWNIMFSESLVPFYLVPFLASIGIMIFQLIKP